MIFLGFFSSYSIDFYSYVWSETVNTCVNDIDLLQQNFDSQKFRIQSERSNKLNFRNGANYEKINNKKHLAKQYLP